MITIILWLNNALYTIHSSYHILSRRLTDHNNKKVSMKIFGYYCSKYQVYCEFLVNKNKSNEQLLCIGQQIKQINKHFLTKDNNFDLEIETPVEIAEKTFLIKIKKKKKTIYDGKPSLNLIK